jgi:hypothetical protein
MPPAWTISFDGYGPVHLGDDASRVLTDAGYSHEPAFNKQVCVEFYRYSSGGPQKTGRQIYEVTVGQIDGQVRYIDIAGGSNSDQLAKVENAPRTDTGLTFGSTVADMRSTYPGITKIKDTWSAKYGGYREWVAQDGDRYLHFSTTGGTNDTVDYLYGIRLNDAPGDQILCS